MYCTYLHVKRTLKNIQGAQKISGQGLTIIDVPTETFLRKKKVKQESFNAHIAEANHNGEEDWEVRFIDQTDTVEDLRKREFFWQHELETFQPNGLNEREVALF